MEFFIGLLSGIGTSLGIGGGSILILFLTLFLGMEQHSAQAINLICFIPAAIVSVLYHLKKKNIVFKECSLILVFGILGAIIGSFLSKSMKVSNLKKAFGIFLFFIALYEIYDFYRFLKLRGQEKNTSN